MLNLKSIKYTAFVILFLALNACQSPPQSHTEDEQVGAQKSQQSFDEFSQEFLDQFWSFHPGWATYVGYYKYDDQLAISDEQSQQALRQFLTSSLAQLNSFDLDKFSASKKTDHVVIKNQLESSLWYLDTFQNHRWDPSSYNVANIFGLILNTDYKPISDRLRTISKRLQFVPAYYQAAKNNIVNPTAEHTQLAIEQNKGALAVFEQLIPAQVGNSDLSDAEVSELNARLSDAVAAINGYLHFLNDLQNLQDPQWRSFRIGPDLYEQKFQLDIVSNLSAEELYEKAIAEKQRLHERMYEIVVELWSNYFPDESIPEDNLVAIRKMIDHLSVKHVKRENFVNEVRAQIPEIQKFMDEKALLDSDPSRPLVVRETPEYQRGFAGASIDAPGPYDATANTYYNVSPLDNMTEEQAESWLREYNHWILQILNIHEAIPGHYTQLVHANKSPSVVKAVFANGAMIEGWAVYSELMMMEAGYGDHEPELWLMYSKWNLRAVINTILDYRVHIEGIEKEAALDLLVREGFQQKAEAEGKWRRATLSQVQLASYFNGYAEILALREELKDKMGEEFDLRAFHNKFLSYGNAPVPAIRRLMLQD